MPLHNLQQYFVAILISEQFKNGFRCKSLFKSTKVFFLMPVGTDTFIYYTRAIFLYGKLWESLCDHFCDTCTLVLPEQFITELDDVVAKCVLDYLVDTEGDFIDELFLCLGCELLYLLGWTVLL